MKNTFSLLGIFILLSLTPVIGNTQCTPPAAVVSTATASLANGFWDKVSYYMEKIPEIFSMNATSYKMIQTGMLAQKNKTNSRMETVTLNQIKLYHPIEGDDNVASAEKTKNRAEALKVKKNEILSSLPFKPEHYNKILPSIDPIQLIVFGKDSYLVIQGQGRIAAMRKALPEDLTLQVEVSDLDEETIGKLKEVRNGYIKAGLLPN